jgi:hypothetical protein
VEISREASSFHRAGNEAVDFKPPPGTAAGTITKVIRIHDLDT